MPEMQQEQLEYFTVVVDGYGYGERLLEGVMFNVHGTVHPDGRYTIDDIAVQEQYESWFKQFNQQMWLNLIRKDFLNPATLREQLGELGATGTQGYEALADRITEPIED